MPVQFRVFRATFISWNSLLDQAARFAGELGPERVISISHSSDHSEGLVVVWYWSKNSDSDRPAAGVAKSAGGDLPADPAPPQDWRCGHCGERNPAPFPSCGGCGKARGVV